MPWGGRAALSRAGQCSQPSPQVALLETNPYLLALTIIVSIVHSVFEFLAFKNGRWGPQGAERPVGGGLAWRAQGREQGRPTSPTWDLSAPLSRRLVSWGGAVTPKVPTQKLPPTS